MSEHGRSQAMIQERWMGPDSGDTISRSRRRFTFTDMIVVFVLTRGAPTDTTQVIASWAYFTGIKGGDLAGEAAISLLPFSRIIATLGLQDSVWSLILVYPSFTVP